LLPIVSSPAKPGRTLRFTDTTAPGPEAVPSARADEEALGQYLDLYLARSMDTTRVALTARVTAYVTDQINWIKQQKADPKNPDVLLPFASFPTFAAQVQEMSNGKVWFCGAFECLYERCSHKFARDLQRFDCVDDLLMKVCKELFHWLAVVATQNDKYGDKIKISNLTYFVHTVPPLQLEILDSFVANATQQRAEAMLRYINWMVAYEFPSLSALAVRLDGVGKKVNEEELSLYIRRTDVLNVVKELDLKTLDGMVTTMYKRLIKHFRSEFDLVCYHRCAMQGLCVHSVIMIPYAIGAKARGADMAATARARGWDFGTIGRGRLSELPDQAGGGAEGAGWTV
jgi:hypothetical protein